MSLVLEGGLFDDEAYWAEVKWLQRHISPVRHLRVIICNVSSASRRDESVLPFIC